MKQTAYHTQKDLLDGRKSSWPSYSKSMMGFTVDKNPFDVADFRLQHNHPAREEYPNSTCLSETFLQGNSCFLFHHSQVGVECSHLLRITETWPSISVNYHSFTSLSSPRLETRTAFFEVVLMVFFCHVESRRWFHKDVLVVLQVIPKGLGLLLLLRSGGKNGRTVLATVWVRAVPTKFLPFLQNLFIGTN